MPVRSNWSREFLQFSHHKNPLFKYNTEGKRVSEKAIQQMQSRNSGSEEINENDRAAIFIRLLYLMEIAALDSLAGRTMFHWCAAPKSNSSDGIDHAASADDIMPPVLVHRSFAVVIHGLLGLEVGHSLFFQFLQAGDRTIQIGLDASLMAGKSGEHAAQLDVQ